MHSFHQSRGRILFEAFCAFAVSASCVGAWIDLGTQAFLLAAAVSAAFGLVRLLDMRGRKSPGAASAADAAVAGAIQGDLLAFVPAAQAEPVVEVWPVVPTEESAPAPKPVAKKPAKPRRKKPAAAAPVIAEPVEEAPVLVAEPMAEANPVTLDEPDPIDVDEASHAPVAPLFEPEPFVRQQRAVFGRKAG